MVGHVPFSWFLGVLVIHDEGILLHVDANVGRLCSLWGGLVIIVISLSRKPS